MKTAFFLFLCLVWFIPQGNAEEIKPLTLVDCYALSLKQSETIGIQQQLIEEAEGRFRRALGGVLPDLSFSSSDKRQDGSGDSAFKLKDVPERKFVLSQTLFAGFKETAAMAGAKAEKRQRRHEKARAEQLLFLDVANAFYLLLEQQKELETLDTIHHSLRERIRELEERERLGRSRLSEMVSTQAQLRRLEAEKAEVRNREIVTRQLLEFLTGRSPIGEIVDSNPSPPSLSSEESYLNKAFSRPDVQAVEEAHQVTQKQVVIARAPTWPEVTVDGNYYVERAGAAEGVDWDVTLEVDVPLFQGGELSGAVKEASARAKAAELALSQIKRRVSLEIQDAYSNFEAALVRRVALEKALLASEANYRLQVKENRLNLVSNLDVLEALQELENARRDFIHASYETKRRYWELRVVTGETL